MINVLDLPGINADGTEDNKTVLARAIGGAPDGEHIYFPHGQYLISTNWISGKTSLKISGEGTLIPVDPLKPIFIVNRNRDSRPTDGLLIEGLRFKGTIKVNGAHHSTIRDCRFMEQSEEPRAYGEPAITVYKSHDIILRDNHIFKRLIGIVSHSPDSRFTGNIITACSVAISSNSANCMIDNNRMFPFDRTSPKTGVMQRCIYLGGLAKYLHNISIRENNLGHPNGIAIVAYSPCTVNDCLIDGNQFLQVEGKDLVYNVIMDESRQNIRRMNRPY